MLLALLVLGASARIDELFAPVLKNGTGDECFEVGQWRPFFDIPIHKTADCPRECQKICQDISNCNWWQWISKEKGVKKKELRGLCQLKTCQPPIARMGYSTMRIKKCTKTFCKDSNQAGGYQPRGGETIYYDPKAKVSGNTKKADPRTYVEYIYNGPKHCDIPAGDMNCTEQLCTQYNKNVLGDKLEDGSLSYGWGELDPMGQCKNACISNQFCTNWAVIYAPEWNKKDGPYYCNLHGSYTGSAPLNNSYSAPQICEMCASSDVVNMSATGEIEKVAASTEEWYQHYIDNCHSDIPLSGHYTTSVTNQVSITNQLTMSHTMSETFTHELTNHFGLSVTVGFKMTVDFSSTLSYDITDTETMSKTNAQTTTRMKSEQKTKITAVEAGFSYTVPGRSRMKIQSTSKRLDGVLPWTANARCLDQDGNMVEEKNIFGNYKSYGLSTSKATAFELACDDSGGGDGPSGGGPCDFIFSPAAACHSCGKKNLPKQPGQMQQVEWTCTDGCDDGKCVCVPPMVYDGNGKCIQTQGPSTVEGSMSFKMGGIEITPFHGASNVSEIHYVDMRHSKTRNEPNSFQMDGWYDDEEEESDDW